MFEFTFAILMLLNLLFPFIGPVRRFIIRELNTDLLEDYLEGFEEGVTDGGDIVVLSFMYFIQLIIGTVIAAILSVIWFLFYPALIIVIGVTFYLTRKHKRNKTNEEL